MHSNLSHLNYPPQPVPQAARHRAEIPGEGNSIRRWLARAIRQWQRRKMIASFEAMDDRLLRDIGVCRSDIHRLVQGFDARELRMAPVAPPTSEAHFSEEVFQKAA